MTLHAKISFVKSVTRMAGYVFLIINFFAGIVILLMSELLGLIEEIYEKK